MRAMPEDHGLLRMRRAIDWAVLETALGAYYDTDVGRPSWPPTVLLRMLIPGQYADLSDREVHEQVGYNLLYRAFVGLGVEDAVPDDTTLVRFRARIGEAGLREVFDALNQQWAAAGLIGAECRVLDGVHLWAKVARQSWVGLLRKGRRVVVDALTQVDAARAAALRAEFVPAGAEVEPRDDGALPRESERTATRGT
jgi:transposase